MPQKAKQQRSTVVETRDISRISVMLRSKIETWIRLILFIYTLWLVVLEP